jgi:hypothetical protein
MDEHDDHGSAERQRLYELSEAATNKPVFRQSLTPEQLAVLDGIYLEQERSMMKTGNWIPEWQRRKAPPSAKPTIVRAKHQQPPPQRQAAGERQPKECPREILWLNQLALDRGVPPNCFQFGYVISQLWSIHTNYADFAQATIADLLGISTRTVPRMIKTLVDRGHLEVRRGNGRNNVSTYRPIVKKPEQSRLIQKRANRKESNL